MAILELHKFPYSPILTRRAKPVKEVNDEIRKLLDDMDDTMRANDGAGIAAPQVGVSLRVAIVDVEKIITEPVEGYEQIGRFEMINPEIIDQQGELDYDEGCLSVPGFWTIMKRKRMLTVKYLDRKGKEKILKAEGVLAVAIQQEMDHLNGKLIIDSASSLKRGIYLQEIKKEGKKK